MKGESDFWGPWVSDEGAPVTARASRCQGNQRSPSQAQPSLDTATFLEPYDKAREG